MTTSAMSDFYRQVENITNALRTASQNREGEVGKQAATLALLLTQQLTANILETFPGVLA